jgi:hypothetical protein
MPGLVDLQEGPPDAIAGPQEAGDIAFRLARPRPSLIARVGVDAVLYPLFGRAGDPGRRVPDAHRLIALWRDRVVELAGHGWDPAAGRGPAATARRLRQLRHCTPPFAAAHAPSSCGLGSLCPHCWAREAMRVWRLADTVFFPPDPVSGRRPEAPICGLVETARVHRLPGTDRSLLAAFLTDRVRRPPPGMPAGPYYRPPEIGQYPLRGGYEAIAVSAADDGGGPGPWEVRIRQLLAVAPGHVDLLQPPPYRGLRIRVIRHDRPDRAELARAVARLFRYPPWLLRGDPVQVLEALAARADLRLGASFGGFRGARPATTPIAGDREDAR